MNRLIIISLIMGFIGTIIANSKGRNVYAWFALCFLFPLSVLFLLFLPPLIGQGRLVRCPRCGNVLEAGAAECRNCKQQMPINMVTCKSCGVIVKEQNRCENCNKPLR